MTLLPNAWYAPAVKRRSPWLRRPCFAQASLGLPVGRGAALRRQASLEPRGSGALSLLGAGGRR